MKKTLLFSLTLMAGVAGVVPFLTTALIPSVSGAVAGNAASDVSSGEVPVETGGLGQRMSVLAPATYEPYVRDFNANDNELYKQAIPNEKAWEFLSQNIPLLDYPDKTVERTYYFRWWTFRKHIKATPDGFIITEFLPDVPWAEKYNAISFSAINSFSEGRWLRNPLYLNDYTKFWLDKRLPLDSKPYLFPVAVALNNRFCVTGDDTLCKKYLPQLVKNLEFWERRQRDPNRLFWQVDGYDGGELSATTNFWRKKTRDNAFYGAASKHYRINSNAAAAAEAFAIAEIASRAGDAATARRLQKGAEELRDLLHAKLWDAEARFYKHAFRGSRPAPIQSALELSPVREQHGYYPWYFPTLNVPKERNVAWEQLCDPKGFYAPYGPTTCEQRSPLFQISYKGHECLWDGPSWPFNTTITLTALANEINRTGAEKLKDAWRKTFDCYVRSHFLQREDGKYVSWIDENLNPYSGDWIARTRLKTWKNGTWDKGKGGVERGKDYNHSAFCDLVITGLIGFRPAAGKKFSLLPLAPKEIPYFALDGIRYHGRTVTIVWDKDGSREYRIGAENQRRKIRAGLSVFVDGREAYHAPALPEEAVVIEMAGDGDGVNAAEGSRR